MIEQPPTWHPLLEELANAQCFSQFIDERLVLSKLNRGEWAVSLLFVAMISSLLCASIRTQ